MPPNTDPPAALEELDHHNVISLTSIDISRNRSRRYTLAWQPNLWDGGALIRSWGRCGTIGRSRATFYANAGQARAERDRLLRLRLRHGYQIVAGSLHTLSKPTAQRKSPRQARGALRSQTRPLACWWLDLHGAPARQLALL